MPYRVCAFLLLLVALPAAGSHGQSRAPVSPELRATIEHAAPADRIAVWVFLSEKESGRLDEARRALTPHARARRARNRGTANLVDARDVPVSDAFIDGLRAQGARIRHVSRWLNAVSIDATPATLERIQALPYARRLDVVRAGRAPLPQPTIESPPPRSRVSTALDYGASGTQIQMMGVDALHDQGLDGSGIWIAMFDTGFNNLGHDAFQNLDVMVTRDFVNGDSLVSDQPGQAGSGNHGCMTLSTIGAYAPGNLIGPAYGATYILAKTENTEWERHMEEDAWVAAAEWADSIGADIISSSLGYSTGFTNGEPSYSWQDMNGNTTIVTLGADIAASRGILVVNSAGNDGFVALPANTLIGPSDGDSVLCVGAVDAFGSRASFSSVGPTFDGRIKPDVMAMGLSVTVASPFDPTSYFGNSGTSFSCPLVAGAAALILQARPAASNQAIMDALRSTASQSGAPGRLMGWGIIDAPAAADIIPTGVGDAPALAARVAIRAARPNPFNPATVIDFQLSAPGRVSLSVYDVTGRLVDTLLDDAYRSAGVHSERYQSSRASGVYFVRLTAGGETATRKVVLLK
ncbi:MAG: S8 family peptidase [Candidatus Krumholzibacteria bacterium]|nr:S8 family peptidase [Candidatus Krumholzibacteria bacterium]MDH4336092.1 S8 family peptidase [Candidatus Krumholzibacteria bacterium]MDH5268733.1 S8 family peptidase [Candidatus Krumholzibacteria bacterium]